jgi:hypothetical protein
VRTIFAQQRPGDAWHQLWRGVDQLGEESTPTPPPFVDDAAENTLANTAYPKGIWRQPCFNIIPSNGSIGVVVEQHDVRQIGQRYMNQSTIQGNPHHRHRHRLGGAPRATSRQRIDQSHERCAN